MWLFNTAFDMFKTLFAYVKKLQLILIDFFLLQEIYFF